MKVISAGQAPITVGIYLSNAIENIDRYLGEGYAAKNPQLVAAYITACVADYTISRQEIMHEQTLG